MNKERILQGIAAHGCYIRGGEWKCFTTQIKAIALFQFPLEESVEQHSEKFRVGQMCNDSMGFFAVPTYAITLD
jgi:hypothetical protein